MTRQLRPPAGRADSSDAPLCSACPALAGRLGNAACTSEAVGGCVGYTAAEGFSSSVGTHRSLWSGLTLLGLGAVHGCCRGRQLRRAGGGSGAPVRCPIACLPAARRGRR